ncbi:MAG: ZIP family metal transporter [Angelakisella sp.]
MSLEEMKILGISLMGPLLGSLIGVAIRPGESLLFGMLSFAGGTMLGISFLQMIPESIMMGGTVGCMLGVSIGVLVMMLAGDFVNGVERGSGKSRAKLETASLMMIAAIFIHNFPEGIAMAAGTHMSQGGKAMLIAIAIATHDIPEGICSSAPYYYSTGKRLRAFLQSASTALPVIVGFFLGKSIFAYINPYAMGMVMGAVAGMMIYVSCKELIPTSQSGKTPKISMTALMMGILFVLLLGNMS